MAGISAYNANDPYEILISQMIALEREPQIRLKEERSGQSVLKGIMKDVDSKISSLHTILGSLSDPNDSPFHGRSATVASGGAYKASADDTAALGSHTVDVQRLASADTRISKQYTASGSDLRTYFNNNGAQTFTVHVAKPTDADPANRVAVDVTVDPTTLADWDPAATTDAEILAHVSEKINAAMTAAVDAGTLDQDDVTTASIVNETSSHARLSLRSGQTGYDNRLTFTGSHTNANKDLLAVLEVSSTAVATGTGGGAVKAVGTSATDSALNSKFVLDGLTLYRNANTVDDALDGITLTLEKAGEGPSDFSVGVDVEAARAKIKDFVAKYNALLSYVASKTDVDAEAGTRGPLAGDGTFRSLRFGLRDDAAQQVDGQPSEGPLTLADIGITAAKDGTLSFSDPDKLTAALEDDAGAVESLFAADDGVATRMTARLDRYLGSNGIVDNRQDSIDLRLKRLDDRIDDWDDRLARREESLRMQFAKLQESVSLIQGQQQYLGSFFGF